jgi:hypothetical protein
VGKMRVREVSRPASKGVRDLNPSRQRNRRIVTPITSFPGPMVNLLDEGC